MKEIKSKIRRQLLSKRKQLSEKERLRLSLEISAKILNLPEYQRAKTVLLYYSFQNEVNTLGLIESTLQLKKNLLLPVSLFESHSLEARQIKNLKNDLYLGKFGIKEPLQKCKTFSEKMIDLIIIPGVGFNLNGARLGYGKGFYDRFLKKCTGKFVGICFECQISNNINSEPHDVNMHKVITEKKCIDCE